MAAKLIGEMVHGDLESAQANIKSLKRQARSYGAVGAKAAETLSALKEFQETR